MFLNSSIFSNPLGDPSDPANSSGDNSTALESAGTALMVLHTKSRQEKAVVADLTARGIGCFLPLIQTVRFYGGRKAKVAVPLFPGYVFMRGALEAAYAADRTKRISNIIQVADQAGLSRELRSLSLALAGQAVLDPFPKLVSGVEVEVKAGPFRGVRGFVIDRYRLDRVHLQVSVLGRGVIMEVDAGLVDIIDQYIPLVRRGA